MKSLPYLSLILIAITSIVLIPLQLKSTGWFLLVITGGILLFCKKDFRNDMLLVLVSLGLLGITSITTDISYRHILQMGTTLVLAVMLPYIVSRYVYKNHLISFPLTNGRKWYKKELFYIFTTAVIAYLLLPFYLRNTGAYLNWTVEPGFTSLFTLFVGTNGLGIWDELFFINTVLAIFKRHFPFTIANAAQAVLFTAFLFELGFRGWAPFVLYPFALTQGYIYNKTHSLLYVIAIHLTLDLVLYLALINAHHPGWLNIFIT